MTIQEKANKYSEDIFGIYPSEEKVHAIVGFKSGYKECLTDLTAFLLANTKLSVKQIIKHLEELK